MCCSPNLSIFIGINLSSDHSWIFQLCVVPQIFRHFIAIDLSSNHLLTFKLCVFRFRCVFLQWLRLTHHPIKCEFSNCVLFANLSTIIAIDLSSNQMWIFKLCFFRQIFPHTSQLTSYLIVCEFSNEALFAKSLNNVLFAKSFHNQCN